MNASPRPSLILVMALAVLPLRGEAAGGAADPEPRLRRFALVASSNDGGPGRGRLRFANSDARAVAEVLRQLGGVRDEDLVVVPDVTAASLRASFERLRSTVHLSPRRPARQEIFVYYSGHSDEEGLLLGGEHVPYRQVRRWIEEVGADVRIAVLDSCASGAVIRRRGGSRQPPFLGDVSADARGHAFLTASSESEAAQESDRIGAGFFTHFLVSGLRGAADTSRDGRVTLGEAYQFAYQETLLRTERSVAGAQHPAYDIQLAGTGDLVLTDLRSTSAGLVLEDDVDGRVLVRDAGGRLVVELRKEPLRPVQLGLGAGRYRLLLEAGGRASEADVVLEDGKTARVGKARFAPAALAAATARGEEQDLAGAGVEPGRVPTFVKRSDEIGGYGGVTFKYARLQGRDAFLAGGELAVLLERRLALGFSGYGSQVQAADPVKNRDEVIFGYGGAFARYFFLFDSPFQLSAALHTSAGAITSTRADQSQVEDVIFVLEPQVGAHLSLTRWMRVGVEAGYRLLAGVDDFRRSDFEGFSAGGHLAFGWF